MRWKAECAEVAYGWEVQRAFRGWKRGGMGHEVTRQSRGDEEAGGDAARACGERGGRAVGDHLKHRVGWVVAPR
jgi:hypothetical protein